MKLTIKVKQLKKSNTKNKTTITSCQPKFNRFGFFYLE